MRERRSVVALRQNRLMGEYCNIKAVVVPSAAAGTVLLTGAAELVTDTIFALDVEMDYVEREVAHDGAGVTCVRPESASSPVTRARRCR